jgi:hypothetical protein
MKLTPGTIVEYDWFNACIHVVEANEDGALEIVSRPMECTGMRLTDTKTGEDVEHVESYNVATHQVVRYELRNGQPFARVNRETGKTHTAVITERRELRVSPIEGWKPELNEPNGMNEPDKPTGHNDESQGVTPEESAFE